MKMSESEKVEGQELAIAKKMDEVILENGISVTLSEELKKKFEPFYVQIQEWKDKVLSIEVTDLNQVDLMKDAREGRLALKSIRVEADKLRKAEKEVYLRKGNAVQSFFNAIKSEIQPLEEHLKEQEDFRVRMEEKQRQERIEKRTTELEPFSAFFPHGTDLGRMEEDDYKKLLNGAKLQLEQKEKEDAAAEERRLEAQRILDLEKSRKHSVVRLVNFIDGYDGISFGEIDAAAFEAIVKSAEKKRDEERERLEAERKESERLLKEKNKQRLEEKRKAKEEKEKRELAEQKLADEREAKSKAEKRTYERSAELQPYIVFIRDYNSLINAEEEVYQKEFAEIKKGAEEHWEIERQQKLSERKEAEEQRRKEEKDAADKLRKEQAPDKQKLIDLGFSIKSIIIPDMTTEAGEALLSEVYDRLSSIRDFITTECEKL